MRHLIFLLCSLPLLGQFTVSFTPLSLEATEAVFSNRAARVGVWQVAVCNDTAETKMVQRERILMTAPHIPVLMNEMAQDILSRRAKDGFWSSAARYGAIGAQFALPALGAWAAAQRETNLAIGAFAGQAGIELGKTAVARAQERAPNPTPYFSMLLPASTALAGGECHTFLAVSGLVRNAAATGLLKLGEPAPSVAANLCGQLTCSEAEILERRRLAVMRTKEVTLAILAQEERAHALGVAH